MTIQDILNRGYLPFADKDATIPINTYYFSTMGAFGAKSKDGSYLGIFFHRGNICITFSLNYVDTDIATGKHGHNPASIDVIRNTKTGFFIETAWNRITSK